MAKKSLVSLIDGISVHSQGSSTFAQEVALPVIKSIDANLRAAGLARAVDHPRYPPGFRPQSLKRRMDGGGVVVVLGLAVFVGSSIGSWVVRKLCDALWDLHLRPALAKLGRSAKGNKNPFSGPFWFEFKVYYTHDDVLVTVRSFISSQADLSAAQRLIPKAELRALAWMQERGIECRELVFTIREGQISEVPRKR